MSSVVSLLAHHIGQFGLDDGLPLRTIHVLG